MDVRIYGVEVIGALTVFYLFDKMPYLRGRTYDPQGTEAACAAPDLVKHAMLIIARRANIRRIRLFIKFR